MAGSQPGIPSKAGSRVLVSHSGTVVLGKTLRRGISTRWRKILSLRQVIAIAGCALLGTAIAVPANAVVGDAVTPPGEFPFTVRLSVGSPESGNGRACTGALLTHEWIVTAKACFAVAGQPVQAGRPVLDSTAVIGGADPSRPASYQSPIVEVVPHPERDVVLARLAAHVADVTPVRVATSAPTVDEELTAVGYGRTATEWIPEVPHSGVFTVRTVGAGGTLDLSATGTGAALCKGDAGGPALRRLPGGEFELVAVHGRSWQSGCLGTPTSETRRDAVEFRVDDLAGWIADQVIDPGADILHNRSSNLCLAVSKGALEDGAAVIQWDCTDPPDQSFRIMARAGGHVELRNVNSGKCLGVADGAIGNSAVVVQRGCDGAEERSWLMRLDADGLARFTNKKSGKCLANPKASTTAGTQMIQYDCRPTNADQGWRIRERGESRTIRNLNSKLCLAIARSVTTEGAQAIQWTCNPVQTRDHNWQVVQVGGGYVELRNALSDKCLGIEGGDVANNRVVQVQCNGAAHHRWRLQGDPYRTVQLRNQLSGKCLAIGSGNTEPGAYAIHWTCNADNPDQQWY